MLFFCCFQLIFKIGYNWHKTLCKFKGNKCWSDTFPYACIILCRSVNSHSQLQPFLLLAHLYAGIRYLILSACPSKTVKWVQHLEPCLVCSKHCISICLIKIRNYSHSPKTYHLVGKIKCTNKQAKTKQHVAQYGRNVTRESGWEEARRLCCVLTSSHLPYSPKQPAVPPILWLKKLRLVGIKGLTRFMCNRSIWTQGWLHWRLLLAPDRIDRGSFGRRLVLDLEAWIEFTRWRDVGSAYRLWGAGTGVGTAWAKMHP